MKRLALTLLLAGLTSLAAAETVTVYTARNEQLVRPLFDAFTRETGIEVRLLTDKEGPLLEKLKAEGENTPADLLLTVDAGNLWAASQAGLLQPVQSKTLQANIPSHLRDPANQWFGLSVRARTIFYNTQRVKPAELSTYEDLASPKWRDRLCLRTSKKVYNQSLVGMLMAQHGAPRTEQIVRGWVTNLATAPLPDDTKLLEAIAAGQCDVGIANTYYYGRLMEKQKELPLGIFWANQSGGGTHVNISGAGVTRHAKNRAAALRLLEWMSSTKAQNLVADVNMEYPANPAVKPDALVASWGPFRQSPLNLGKAGENQVAATLLMDRAGYK